MTTRTQCVCNVSDSRRNRSTLHKLSFVCPRNVSHDGPELDSGRKCSARILRTTSLSMSTPNASETCWALRRQTHVELRRFISTTASMSSCAGPFGPGRLLRLGENKARYLHWTSILWKRRSVDGFRTIADLRTRDGRMRHVHTKSERPLQ